MRRAQQAVRVDEASCASTFRELDDAFLQTQTKVWLGEVLHLRFDEDVLVADLLADGELLFQVSKVIWKKLLKKNRELLKQSKFYIYERTSFGRSNGKYMPYSKVDSFLKICQILGLAGIDLFTPSDVVEKRNVRKVCICIRSVSKKSRMMRVNVPDFDIVTYTIAMPNYIVGGICRSLEQPQYSSSDSSGYSPRANSKELQQQIIFGGRNDQHGDVDTCYDSDEAESRPSVPQPEDSVDDDSFAAMLLQLSDAPKEESEGYGESEHDMHEEKSLAESVGSLNFDVDSDFVESTPLTQNKESCSTQSATDQCSRTRTTKRSLSSEELDSISGHLVIDSAKNDMELVTPVSVSESIYDGHVNNLDHAIQRNSERFTDHGKQENVDLQKDSGSVGQHRDVVVCDRESICSSGEEPRDGMNGEPSDLSSVSYLTPKHTTGGNLPVVSEDSANSIESSRNKAIHDTGMTNDSTSRELKHEFCSRDQLSPVEMLQDISQSEDKPVKSEESDSISGHLVIDSSKNDMELVTPVSVSESIYDEHVKNLDHAIQRNGERFTDHGKQENVDLQKDSGTVGQHCDAFVCDRESICSSREEPRYGMHSEPSDLSSVSYSGSTPNHSAGGNLPVVSEDSANSIEPSMNTTIHVTGMTNDSTSRELKHESCSRDQSPVEMLQDISQSEDKPVKSEESDSISSHLVIDSARNDTELVTPVSVSESIYDGHVNNLDPAIERNGERFTDHGKQENVDLQKDSGTVGQHCDAFVCDRESICSSCEEPRYGMNGEPSAFGSVSYSGLTPKHTTGGNLPVVSEDSTNSIEPSMNKAIHVTGMTNDSTSRELKYESCSRDQMPPVEMLQDTSQSEDKPVKSEDTAKNSIAPQKPEDDAPKGKGVLKSVAGGITLVGAVFFIVHLRRSKERSFTTVIPSLSDKSTQSDSRAKNMDKGKGAAVYPGEWLKDYKPGETILDWPARKRVATGTARGSEYLHENCSPKIIHRDIKAANVLLDEDFEPVVGDFGLVKLVDVRKSSEKTDVFGYGIMLLELVTAKRASDFPHLVDENDVLFLDHLKKLQREGHLKTIVDRSLNRSYNGQEVEMMVQIALLCTQPYPEDRPSMSKVVRMLDGEGLAEQWEECQLAMMRRQEYEWMQQPVAELQ
ncbi:hypothetical protein ACP70R_024641 [Stipagrostis hirtigluma subsp. patula]